MNEVDPNGFPMNLSRGDREPASLPALPSLGADERAVFEWQMWVDGLGESGQRKLKGASVLVSRCGGVGGAAATYWPLPAWAGW
jgi:hypothetical protein